MQQSRLEELARKSPHLNDGISRVLTVEYGLEGVSYKLLETGPGVTEKAEDTPFPVERRSREYVSEKDHSGPHVESLDYQNVTVSRPEGSPYRLVAKNNDSIINNFTLVYRWGGLMVATLMLHSDELPGVLRPFIRISSPKDGHAVALKDGMKIECCREVSEETDEKDAMFDVAASEIPYTCNYMGSRTIIEYSRGTFEIRFSDANGVFDLAIFPESLDKNIEGLFEFENNKWLSFPEMAGMRYFSRVLEKHMAK